MTKFDSYVICTSPRSGSTLLCKLLARTGVAGNPASYFHRPSVFAWCDDLGLARESSIPECDLLEMVFRTAISKGSLATGMFGLRLQRGSFDFFSQKLAILYPGFSGDAQRFHAAFGCTSFIHLTRLDKVEQAVSHVKADQTGLWHMAPDGSELERLAPPGTPAYDAWQIRARFDELTAYDREWEKWFEAEQIEPLCITYEMLSKDPIGALRRVLGHLGLDRGAADNVKSEVAKLADDTSRDWVARFRFERNLA